jgi:hypothetical protein
MKTINLTIRLRDNEHIYHFEKFIRNEVEVVDFKILPDIKELYEKDDNFKKIVKGVKDAQLIRDRYINDHNY